ncbi:TonB-dependent receptor domain-containing protein [Mucilaginibacter calamicampi]|uniref:TonB-dependent receptor domain-containing protein n=1 Tax=Mucilaginibacter calamicampi TaxID=1302352 RepID=A0ABW2YRY2_9SPHI
MKKHLLILISLCFSISLSAQNTPKIITVKGLTIDSATNKALDFVTVALVDPQTKAAVKSMLTKEDGSFELSAPAGKTYQLALAFMGYASKVIIITNSTTDTDAGKILLSPSISTLNEVSITGLKPLVKREVDRIAYNVQSDPESKAITALDMMRKVPMLSVDANDNIKLRGNGSYKILINNKESALLARNPSDILKAMPASNILKIEVITTPPAKYDAEGLAGIINIITKKDADQGYNGSINTGYNTVWGYRSNLNLTVKQGKFGYTGYVGFNRRRAQTNPFENNSTFFEKGTEKISGTLTQNGTRSNSNRNTYTGNELSFELDTLNLFTGTFNYYRGGNNSSNMQSTIQRKANGSIDMDYLTQNTGVSTWGGMDAGINYQHSFKRNKEQLLTLSYKYSNAAPNSQENYITSNHGLGYTVPDYTQYNNNGTKEYTTQLDYIHPMKVLTVEAGGKMILRNSFSTSPATVVQKANDFIYHQDVYGLYNSYLLKYTKWTYKAGLRFERTNVRTDGGGVDQAYNNIVPTFSMQRLLDSVSSLTFGFTQRIQRPSIYQLNPFTNTSNQQYVTSGNPDLRPSVNNNFELAYSKTGKGSLNITASYSFANNTIENVANISTVTSGTTNTIVTTTTFANVGQNRRLGINADLNYPITKKLNVNINAQLMRVWLRGTYNGAFYSNSGQQGYIFTNTSYKFNNGLRIGTNLGFDSRYVMLQGTDNYWIDYSFSMQKEFFKGKLNVSVSANDPFKKFIRLDFSTRTPDFESYNVNYNFYRTFNFGLNYKFGGLNASIKKNQRGISNDDTSSGGRSQ